MLDTLAAIRSEIEHGLPHERDRMTQSKEQIDYYRGDFDCWESMSQEDQDLGKIRRPLLFMQWCVNTLGRLYATGPAREITDDSTATDWLATLYTKEGIDGLMQEADRLGIAGDVAAVQVVSTGDHSRPIRFSLWPAHQFVVWDSPDDPTQPVAVAIIDVFDERRRLRLYTVDVEQTYETDKGMQQSYAFHLVDEQPNPFGVIPFAFVHANPPTTQFWSHGPGKVLTDANKYINRSLTETGDSIRYGVNPRLWAFGCANKPPSPWPPGVMWHAEGVAYDEAGNGIAPEVGYLQSDPGFVDAQWADINSYIDIALESVNVPPATFRMVQTGAASGVALVAEQLPVLQAIEAKQRPFLAYERELARITLAIGGFDPAKADDLTLRWPEIVPRSLLYGAQEDEADQADLDLGLTSRIMIAMRRLNVSREQAVAHLKQVADDMKEEETIGLPPIPSKQQPPQLAKDDGNDLRDEGENSEAGSGSTDAGSD